MKGRGPEQQPCLCPLSSLLSLVVHKPQSDSFQATFLALLLRGERWGRALDFYFIIILNMDLWLMVRDFLFDLTTQNPGGWGKRNEERGSLPRRTVCSLRAEGVSTWPLCCQPQLPALEDGGAAAHIRGRIL